jgi:hypothetical protein
MAKAKKKATTTARDSTKERTNGNRTAAWSFTGAFTLIGLGFGFLYGQILPGLFLGIGIGLLVSMILRYRHATK